MTRKKDLRRQLEEARQYEDYLKERIAEYQKVQQRDCVIGPHCRYCSNMLHEPTEYYNVSDGRMVTLNNVCRHQIPCTKFSLMEPSPTDK